MINLTEQNFEFHLKAGRWIVDVWQDGCADCNAFAPIFRTAEKQNKTATKFANFKVPRQGASEFRTKYLKFEKGEPAASPTVIVFEDGKMIKRVAGVVDLFSLSGLVENSELPDLKKIPKNELKIMAFDCMENIGMYGALQADSQIFYGKLQEAINSPVEEETKE